ncbi:12994_t:CDS:1, partial [Racocetra persica]
SFLPELATGYKTQHCYLLYALKLPIPISTRKTQSKPCYINPELNNIPQCNICPKNSRGYPKSATHLPYLVPTQLPR